MTWRLDGTYFENCNCEVVCPCTAADFAAPADHERCRVLIAFHVDSGRIDGVDVAGMTVGVFADTPPMMIEGNWRVGLFMDGKASEQQAAKLGAVFSGQMGGPMAGLAPLISEFLGIESAPIEYASEGRRHSIRIGERVDIVVEDIASPLDPQGPSPRLTGLHHPANSTLTAARATSSRISAFGIEISNAGKNGFSAPFSWTA
jgi:hypothetical protein